MRTIPLTLLLPLLILTIPLPGSSADLWAEYGEFATKLPAIDPTPAGDGHIGLVGSGTAVQLRFPVPKEPVAGYWLALGNIVGYTGKGSSYKLVLRRDTEDGPIIHEGPVIRNGDEWNGSNRQIIEITGKLTDADRARGHLDIFATGIIEGDGWTIYRHRPGRPVYAYAAILSPELQRRIEAAKALKRRGVSIIPMPKQITVLPEDDFAITASTRIAYGGDSVEVVAFAARELQALIQERTGLKLDTTEAKRPADGDIILWCDVSASREADPINRDSYVLAVGRKLAQVSGLGLPGCFYGAMTLGQMAQPAGDGAAVIPGCRIEDRPSFPYRIIQYDIARGQTVNVDYVKRVIRELARCKINALLFYMEDDFRFRKYPFLGREGTFTHEKAKELSEYAKQCHMQLIPQFESLGHAGAVLRHDEMKDLREAGNAWVFCTSEPRTWEFLDDVFGELVEAFGYTEFIHVGADEFESGFGKCERCRAKVEAEGIGALYAEHMNKLNQLVKKRGKTMMFWPSHHGPTPELSKMTLQYQDKLEKDCIPTEWIYHGPSSYPTIEEYQNLGFKDVHCSPAVVSYSRVWPDYRTTFRGIRGFYRAGEERGCGGAYCTTWEFMHGALVENSMYGLIFAAECSWNPQSTSQAEFDRRFADVWFGVRGEDSRGTGVSPVSRIGDTICDPFPTSGKDAMWRNTRMVTQLLWSMPRDVMREYALKQPHIAENVGTLGPLMDEAIRRVDAMSDSATRNHLTLRAAGLAFRMMGYAGRKLATFKDATRLYERAAKPPIAWADLAEIITHLKGRQREAEALAEEYDYFVQNCGAYKGDVERLQQQAEQLGELAAKLEDLVAKVKAGEIKELPPGSDFGFLTGSYAKAGEWTPEQMSEEGATLRFDVSTLLTGPGKFQVEWQYDRGAHGLEIRKTRLLRDGEVVSEDEHGGWAGSGSRGNIYSLELTDHDPAAKYEILGEVVSRGGTDSRGTVWLVRP